MNIAAATMTVPWGEAQRSFVAYRRALKDKTATREDLMLYRGFRALMRGQKVIDINLAIAGGGLDPHGRPRLAVCRADVEWCHCFTQHAREKLVFSTRDRLGRRPRGEVVMPTSAFGRVLDRDLSSLRAHLPTIPPQFRPPDDLSKYHLLWEAEWQPRPPVDPLLLKHVDGPFFVVLAAWDLSPLEQAVLRQRL